jgi:hypothetical protein
MVIKAEIEINAPLRVVWQTFSRMEDWDDWNEACRSCCIISGDENLPVGTCFSFVIRPLVFPMKVQPRIVKCDPGREVVWEGGKMGIHASHTWQFREQDGKVRFLSVEHFKGPDGVGGISAACTEAAASLDDSLSANVKNRIGSVWLMTAPTMAMIAATSPSMTDSQNGAEEMIKNVLA